MENYKLVIKKSAKKEISNLPKKDLHKIISKIQSLKENPTPIGSRKLSGQNKYRIRQGDYRILYSIEDYLKILSVIKVGHRKEVYR